MEPSKEKLSFAYYHDATEQKIEFTTSIAPENLSVGCLIPYKIPFDKFVEEKHFTISYNKGLYWAHNHSRFGTYVKAQQKSIKLPHNTEVIMGETQLNLGLSQSKGVIQIHNLLTEATTLRQNLELNKDYTVGRKSVDIIVDDDKKMSEIHCVIKFTAHEVILTEAPTTNGIWISFISGPINSEGIDFRIGLSTFISIKVAFNDEETTKIKTNYFNINDFNYAINKIDVSYESVTEKLNGKTPHMLTSSNIDFFKQNGLTDYQRDFLMEENNDNFANAKRELMQLVKIPYEPKMLEKVKEMVPHCTEMQIKLANRRGCNTLDKIVIHVIEIDTILEHIK